MSGGSRAEIRGQQAAPATEMEILNLSGKPTHSPLSRSLPSNRDSKRVFKRDQVLKIFYF